jgi:bifunctional ADP-heptose synthase (sugar kinase/adenylyltransferase)
MRSSATTINAFIFGDLVLDHVIPITDKTGPYSPVGDEQVFAGQTRITVPGGAGNSARAIAALGKGRVCLWGLSGHSPWGSFPDILRHWQEIEGSSLNRITYYGAHNDNHQMNTITRIIRNFSEDDQSRRLRIDDVHYIHPTDGQIRDAIAYLNAEITDNGVDIILVHDLNMRAITPDLLRHISDISSEHNIPVFVDPKREWTTFANLSVTCALPNLTEWSHIVKDDIRNWRNGLSNPEVLKDVALRSIHYMPNAIFHVIKCDKDGLIFVAPKDVGELLVFHLTAQPLPNKIKVDQIGSGDILAGSLAMAFAQYVKRSTKFPSAEMMIDFLKNASTAVACYLVSPWQHIPDITEIIRFQRDNRERPAVAAKVSVPAGISVLPTGSHINLTPLSIMHSRLVTVDQKYREQVESLIDFLAAGWEISNPRHAVLTGQGGLGKSEVIKILKRILEKREIGVFEDLLRSRRCKDVAAAMTRIRNVRKRSSNHYRNGILIVADEAFKRYGHILFGEAGVDLLDSVRHIERTRFLFIDANYENHIKDLDRQHQFVRRVKKFELPDLTERLVDIPYIFARSCLSLLEDSEINQIRISEAVLLGVINNFITLPAPDRNTETIRECAKQVVDSARGKAGGQFAAKSILELSKRYLPEKLATAVGSQQHERKFIEFRCDGQ